MWRPSRVCPVLCLNHTKIVLPTLPSSCQFRAYRKKFLNKIQGQDDLPFPGSAKWCYRAYQYRRYSGMTHISFSPQRLKKVLTLMISCRAYRYQQYSAVQCSKTEHKEMIKPRQFFENITHLRNFFVSLCQCKVNCQTKPIDKRQVLRIFSLQ